MAIIGYDEQGNPIESQQAEGQPAGVWRDEGGNLRNADGSPFTPETKPKDPYQDIAYWQNKGYGTNDMFDENGQTKPGWSRTAKGYEYTAPTATAPTTGAVGKGGGGLPSSTLGTLLQPFGQPPPTYVSPDYVDPSGAYPTAPNFPTIPDWQSPTGEQARNLPGYEFARQEGLRGLEQSAAARGVTNTGGTLEDIVKFGDQFGTQNYQTARANSFEDWQANIANKYLLPYQAAYNTWSVKYPQAGADAQNRTNFNVTNANNRNNFDWNNYTQGFNIFDKQRNFVGDQFARLAALGAGVQ